RQLVDHLRNVSRGKIAKRLTERAKTARLDQLLDLWADKVADHSSRVVSASGIEWKGESGCHADITCRSHWILAARWGTTTIATTGGVRFVSDALQWNERATRHLSRCGG